MIIAKKLNFCKVHPRVGSFLDSRSNSSSLYRVKKSIADPIQLLQWYLLKCNHFALFKIFFYCGWFLVIAMFGFFFSGTQATKFFNCYVTHLLSHSLTGTQRTKQSSGVNFWSLRCKSCKAIGTSTKMVPVKIVFYSTSIIKQYLMM